MGARGGAGGVMQSGAMGSSEAVVLGLLLGVLSEAACESHSVRYFLTGITDPGPGMPQYMAVGYVDGTPFGNYNSERWTVQPIVDWLAQEDVKHWDVETKKARSGELDFYMALDWLQEHYNKSRERPEVRVWGKEADEILTLSCRAYAFYPRPIAISWMKDSVVQDQETHWGGIVPNSDGTYHALTTIDVLPGDRDKYRCHVEHARMLQSGLFSWELQPNLILIVAGVVFVAVVAAVIGLLVWKSKSGKDEKGYRAALGHDGESSSLATGSESSI